MWWPLSLALYTLLARSVPSANYHHPLQNGFEYTTRRNGRTFTKNQHDLRRFLDYHLKKADNGWDSTPPVRLAVLDYGNPAGDIVDRSENEWPLKRTEYVKYFLAPGGRLIPNNGGTSPDTISDSVKYDGKTGRATFEYKFDQDLETTGYFMTHLDVSCNGHDDMDLFVQIEKFNSAGWRQATQSIRPASRLVQSILSAAHDWNVGMSKLSLLFSFGPDGRMRVSHATEKDEKLSKVGRPYYTHRRAVPLAPGEQRAVDIGLRPGSIQWRVSTQHPFHKSQPSIIGLRLMAVTANDATTRLATFYDLRSREIS